MASLIVEVIKLEIVQSSNSDATGYNPRLKVTLVPTTDEPVNEITLLLPTTDKFYQLGSRHILGITLPYYEN